MTHQEIPDQQLNKCLEWVAFNLQPAQQKPTKRQLEKMEQECKMNLEEQV
jgi:hypothetical protein